MPQILLLRHSKSAANADGLLAGGKTDSPLNDEGKVLAHKKGQQLLHDGFSPTEVFTSTLSRAEQTATIILDELNINLAVKKIPELKERSFGDYDGKPFNLMMNAFDALGPNPPTVENVDDFVKRVITGFEEAKKLTTETGLIITHVNVIAAIHCFLFDKERLAEFWETYSADYCEGFVYSY